MNEFTLKEHKKSKQHKQRVKELKIPSYSHEESEHAAGMGSYHKPTSQTTMDIDNNNTEKNNINT